MKNFTKFLAVILCLVIALSTAACSLKPQWSYKEAGTDEELPIGVYIYALYSAYNEALQYARETDAYNEETGLYNGETSFLNVKITDYDGNTAIASTWIREKAEKTMKTFIAINKEYDRLGATMDEAKVKESIKGKWTGESYKNDPMYAQYLAMGYSFPSDQSILEPFDISYDSYEYVNLTSQKESVIFDKLYREGGEKAVSDEDLKKYFTDNYTSYTYFNTNLYTTDTVEGSASSTGALTTSTAMSDDEIKKHEKRFEGYVNDIKNGKSLDDVIKTYKTDYELKTEDTTATSSKIELTKEISAGDDIKTTLESLNIGEAAYITVGEGDQKSLYFIYKSSIVKESETYFDSANNKEADDNRYTTLANMKGDEYKDYIQALATSTKVEKSKYVDKYDPKMFEPKEEK